MICGIRHMVWFASATVLAGLTLVTPARGQNLAPVVISPSTVVRYRTSLAGYEGTWAIAPTTVALEAGVSTDAVPTVTLRSIHLSSSSVSCDVALSFGAVPVSWSGPVVDAAPSAVVIPTTIGLSGAAEFSTSGVMTAALGTANYLVQGPSCLNLNASVTPCTGPFNLSLIPVGPRSSIQSGSVGTTGASRPFSMSLLSSIPMVSGTTWGRMEVLATIVGTVNVAASGCAADFDHSGGLAVQDIFSFLNAWFAAGPGADFNQTGGITVQDIFDFLNAWFAGCP